MNEVHQPPPQSDGNPDESPNRGPNLTLYYGVLILALLAAIAIAAFIVLPFYHRH